MTLTPSMSLAIIKNHVKDGVALAREYNLPHERRSRSSSSTTARR